MPPDPDDGPEALAGIVYVSRETRDRLSTFVGLLRKWQPAENLISPATLPALWRRHVADSAQLVPIFPAVRTWLDVGSGGGFPGLIVACLIADTPDRHVHLVESNQRKCAFLRRVVSEARLPATIHQGRAEATLEAWETPVDLVTARAVAPLARLLAMAAPVLTRGVPAAFHKGRDFEGEIDEASKSWGFDLIIHKSRIEEDGVILEISGLHRKGRHPARQDRP